MLAIQDTRTDRAAEKKRGNRILVVEDSELQAYQLIGILEADKLEVEIASDAERGLLLF